MKLPWSRVVAALLMQIAARTLLCLMALVASVERAAAEGALEEGLAAYRSEDYAKALELWRVLADNGDPSAQVRLAVMYAEGKGVEQNDTTAMMWFQRAADRGSAIAQYNVGASYAAGLGVARDDAAAAKWFRRAADQGLAFAQLNLGLLYAAGRGVPQDNTEAMKWFQLAVFALPAGGPRSDATRAMQDVAEKMTALELQAARESAKAWKAKPEGK